MSLNLPSRRVLQTASHCLRQAPSPTPASLCVSLQSLSLSPSQGPHGVSTHQRRALSWFGFGKAKKDGAAVKDRSPGSELSSAASRKALMDDLTNSRLAGSSIFTDELVKADGSAQAGAGAPGGGKAATAMGGSLAREHLTRAVDPDPRSRVRWERRMVARRVRRALSPYGRETRAEWLRRVERELHSRSARLATSTKKLVHLARQVAGKSVEDAIVQMRFSKKKMAREVKWHLEEARDQAIVERGMGLGRVNGEVLGEGNGRKILTKDGKWMTVQDPTSLYVDQAWVGKSEKRGAYVDMRARGRAFINDRVTSRLYLIVKEEKTRIRQHQERETKKAAKTPWVHLPNRPVTSQRQYYSW